MNFVIPRSVSDTDVLTLVNAGTQAREAGGALVWKDNFLTRGSAIAHQAGAIAVQIHQPGVYLAIFHGTLSAAASFSAPATAIVQLTLNGSPIPGATARQTVASSDAVAGLAISLPFEATGASRLEVTMQNGGLALDNTALTVIRLGN